MGSVDDILQLCRLCLVKDQVNIPIFDETSDIRQTFLKINSCLPVKVSRDDSLPKKICDGCSYKLDMLYVFRNTSVDSEKQLLSWLDQIGLSTNSMLQDQDAESEKPEVTVKQEALESSDRIEEGEDDNGDMGDDSHSYLMQQQKLPYQDFEFGEPSSSNTDLMGSDEPAPKRAKRAAAMKKHVSEETEEDELDAAMQITKAEDEDSDEIDNPDFGEEEIPSTSADDQDQPGPSGVGKGSIEAPYPTSEIVSEIDNQKVEIHGNCPDGCKNYKFHFDRTIMAGTVVCADCGTLYKKPDPKPKSGDFYCKFCRKAFDDPSSVDVHVMTNHQCRYCDKIFTTMGRLNGHLRNVHHPKRYKCDFCDKSFVHKCNLKEHVKVCHSEDPTQFKCDICNKRFMTNSSLRTHKKEIHEVGEYLCSECGADFTNYNKFRTHVRNGHRENEFQCEFCEKAFRTEYLLKIHILTHMPDREFVCEQCGKRFRTNSELCRHQFVAHSKELPHGCGICYKRFPYKSSVMKHITYVHCKNKVL